MAATPTATTWEAAPVDLATWLPEGPTLVAMCAIPGTGKSTIVQKMFQRQGWTIIELDAIRAKIPGSTGPGDQSVTPQAVRRAHAITHRVLANGGRIVSDATNVQSRVRKELLGQAAQYQANAYLLAVHAPFETAVERNNGRERVVPHDVLERMYQQLLATNQAAPAEGWQGLWTIDND